MDVRRWILDFRLSLAFHVYIKYPTTTNVQYLLMSNI